MDDPRVKIAATRLAHVSARKASLVMVALSAPEVLWLHKILRERHAGRRRRGRWLCGRDGLRGRDEPVLPLSIIVAYNTILNNWYHWFILV